MKSNFKKNVLYSFIFCFIFLFLIFLTNTSNAASEYYSFEDDNYGTIKYTIPDNAVNYCISQYHEGYYCFIYTDNSNYRFAVRNENDTYKIVALYTDSNYTIQANYYRCHTTDNWAIQPFYNTDLGCYFLDFASCSSALLENEVLYFSIFNTSSQDLMNIDDNTLFYDNFDEPSFITSKDELESGKFDVLKIDAGDLDYSDASSRFLLNIYLGTYINDNIYNYSIQKTILLEYSSSYLYKNNLDLYYYIPRDKLGIDLSNGKRYMFELKEKGGDSVYSNINFTITGLTLEDEKNNYDDLTHQKMDEQTEAIKESNETNKGIWGTLKEVLSFINPFSENFFVYKLLELLSDLLKSLFVPSSEFMSQWFTDISDYFEEAFGILYYPVDLVIQVLSRFDSITGQEPVISFGNLTLFNVVLIPAYSYNFNDLLSNDTLQMIHNFYLITIDVILWLGLLVYCKNVCANIFGGKFTDDVIHEVQDPGGYGRTEARVSRYNSVKQKLNGQKKG